VLALRAIVLNLHSRSIRANRVTEQTKQELIAKADDGKLERARQRLAAPPRNPS
jgi:hypothetical protein